MVVTRFALATAATAAIVARFKAATTTIVVARLDAATTVITRLETAATAPVVARFATAAAAIVLTVGAAVSLSVGLTVSLAIGAAIFVTRTFAGFAGNGGLGGEQAEGGDAAGGNDGKLVHGNGFLRFEGMVQGAGCGSVRFEAPQCALPLDNGAGADLFQKIHAIFTTRLREYSRATAVLPRVLARVSKAWRDLS